MRVIVVLRSKKAFFFNLNNTQAASIALAIPVYNCYRVVGSVSLIYLTPSDSHKINECIFAAPWPASEG
jgi:hypothetical protein